MAESINVKDSSAHCRHCDTQMVVIKVKKYPGKWPLALLGLGFICFLFIHFGGPIIGIPMMLIGWHMFSADQLLNMCPRCGYHFDVLSVRGADSHA